MILKDVLNPFFNPPILRPIFGGGDPFWNPLTLGADNLCWLDYLDINQLNVTNDTNHNMSSIIDKSLNNRLFSQTNPANRPTYSLEGAIFQRGFDFMVHNGAFFAHNSGGFRIFATVKNETESQGSEGAIITESNFTPDARPFFNPLCKVIDDGTLRNRIGAVYRTNTAGQILLTSSTTKSNIPSLSLTGFNLIEMQDTGGVYRNFTNAVQTNETTYIRTGAITPTNRTTIGAILNSSGFTNTGGWTIKDIIVTTNNLSNEQLEKTRGYLAHKAGTQALLPINHPYRNIPPMANALMNNYLLIQNNNYMTAQNGKRLIL